MKIIKYCPYCGSPEIDEQEGVKNSIFIWCPDCNNSFNIYQNIEERDFMPEN